MAASEGLVAALERLVATPEGLVAHLRMLRQTLPSRSMLGW